MDKQYKVVQAEALIEGRFRYRDEVLTMTLTRATPYIDAGIVEEAVQTNEGAEHVVDAQHLLAAAARGKFGDAAVAETLKSTNAFADIEPEERETPGADTEGKTEKKTGVKAKE